MNYKYEFQGNEAASDESGKGDFFGGIVVCVLYLDLKNYQKLENSNILINIKDSKKISNQKIKEIAPEIMKIFAGNYFYINCNAEQYNKIYKKFKNLNILLSFIHNKVWNELSKNIKNLENYNSIIDEFTPKKYYENYLKSINIKPFSIKQFSTKAESKYISCALASIIARYFFIKQIEEIRKKYNVEIPFGNSYEPENSVINAFNELKNKIPQEEIIQKLCKNHFKTLEKIF